MNQFRIMALVALLSAAVSTGLQASEPTSPSDKMSLSSSSSVGQQALTFPQQVARYEAQQRVMRMQWNANIGYSPLRPNMNASWMSNGVQVFYIPSRSVFVSTNSARAWYW